MDFDELAARYHELQTAAARLAATLPDPPAGWPEQAADALSRLRRVLTAPASTPEAAGDLRNPTRHVLVRARYERLADGTSTSHPIPLAEAAANWRQWVDGGRPEEATLEVSGGSGVAMSSVRAMVVATMLEELARRIEAGRAVGPIESDDSMSKLAQELADDLHNRAGI